MSTPTAAKLKTLPTEIRALRATIDQEMTSLGETIGKGNAATQIATVAKLRGLIKQIESKIDAYRAACRQAKIETKDPYDACSPNGYMGSMMWISRHNNSLKEYSTKLQAATKPGTPSPRSTPTTATPKAPAKKTAQSGEHAAGIIGFFHRNERYFLWGLVGLGLYAISMPSLTARKERRRRKKRSRR